MLGLRAVEPHGLGVHDADGISEKLLGCTDGGVGRHEPGEESIAGVGLYIGNRYAGLIECRLDNGVVLQGDEKTVFEVCIICN